MIQDIIKVRTKLDARRIREFETSSQGGVDVLDTGADDYVPAGIAEGTCFRYLKSRGIEKPGGRPLRDVGIAHQIRAVHDRAACPGDIGADDRGQRSARLKGADCLQLPSSRPAIAP